MYMTSNDEESRCTCTVGVGSSCSVHYDEPSSDVLEKSRQDFNSLNDYDFSSMYHHIVPLVTDLECKKTRSFKVRWIESVTDKAALVLSKKRKWFWIPLSAIEDMTTTPKGYWKITVYDYFKEKEVDVKTHHYFERDEYL